ncbi:MAG: hypothetical protein HN742_02090 [Lentisphaerae bacterium]|jgi:hypothetical protein|nr:hypothetical protein [Lentisphaerota bacterium]MBT4819248.1 hypothetical protein [Lentisphaerota bacterium]MBT5610223.1 hypothetical protein [Lentisphaerota bacterium]MBT7060043.1 hypothetical protein [Lentisphaerota bacterium]MBT7840627.1 hypothetical protein [Lentisphaerota bacterium]
MDQQTLRDRVAECLYSSPAGRQDVAAASFAPVDDPISLVRACLAQSWPDHGPGQVLEDHFTLPHLLGQYPGELLSFQAPPDYTPDRTWGLVVLLHGGGSGTPRETAKLWLADDDGSGGYHFGEKLRELDLIAVAPSNLLQPNHKRWSNPESDAYILGVIEEAMARYHIDPDRVCLCGQSMGGFGAYHIVQTIGDRFATVGAHAGAWYYGFWEAMEAVDFHILHGSEDAAPGTRPRFTDTPFARFAHAVLSGYHLPHTYTEHAGGHSFSDPLARRAADVFFDRATTVRRNPVPDSILTASRKGAFKLYDSPHHFWLSIGDTHFGTFELDHVEPTESQPSYCTTNFRHRLIRCPGGTLRAINHRDNTIELWPHNVDEATVWLNDDMVDFNKPVRILVAGKEVFSAQVTPSLETVIESYGRRRDPGMLFSAKVDLDLKVNDWELQKQIR